jgi:hypothetical protein
LFEIQVRNDSHFRDISNRRDGETGKEIAGFGMIGGAGLAMLCGTLAIPALLAMAGGAMVASANSNGAGKYLFTLLG